MISCNSTSQGQQSGANFYHKVQYTHTHTHTPSPLPTCRCRLISQRTALGWVWPAAHEVLASAVLSFCSHRRTSGGGGGGGIVRLQQYSKYEIVKVKSALIPVNISDLVRYSCAYLYLESVCPSAGFLVEQVKQVSSVLLGACEVLGVWLDDVMATPTATLTWSSPGTLVQRVSGSETML